MTKVRVAGFSVSLDGYAAGTEQSLSHPLGQKGPELFPWFFPTRTFRAMLAQDGGTTGVDDRYAQRSMAGFGAFILGRNMFAPLCGAPGPTTRGKAGGATTRRITRPPTSSPTTRERRSSSRAAPPSTS